MQQNLFPLPHPPIIQPPPINHIMTRRTTIDCPEIIAFNYLYQFPGMTLRDYFAAKTIQAWLSQIAPEEMEDMMNRWADNSYEMADAMLKAREV
ncbi:hypothetical protein [Dickeya zeae]|uniref:hypothetical protein n=1 Tax=Dickeya zeae TaxID=204042 RepID=UPI0006ACE340|nr:hypothetical protein [Dickeya zeae]